MVRVKKEILTLSSTTSQTLVFLALEVSEIWVSGNQPHSPQCWPRPDWCACLRVPSTMSPRAGRSAWAFLHLLKILQTPMCPPAWVFEFSVSGGSGSKEKIFWDFWENFCNFQLSKQGGNWRKNGVNFFLSSPRTSHQGYDSSRKLFSFIWFTILCSPQCTTQPYTCICTCVCIYVDDTLIHVHTKNLYRFMYFIKIYEIQRKLHIIGVIEDCTLSSYTLSWVYQVDEYINVHKYARECSHVYFVGQKLWQDSSTYILCTYILVSEFSFLYFIVKKTNSERTGNQI